jgi:hypothetical protein
MSLPHSESARAVGCCTAGLDQQPVDADEDAVVGHERYPQPQRGRRYPSVRLVDLLSESVPVVFATHAAQACIISSSGRTTVNRSRSRSRPRRRRSPHPAFNAPYRSSVTVTNDTKVTRPPTRSRNSPASADHRSGLINALTAMVSITTAAPDDAWVTAQQGRRSARSTHQGSNPRSSTPRHSGAAAHGAAPPREETPPTRACRAARPQTRLKV